MKRALIALVALGAVLAVVACADDEPATVAAAAPDEEDEAYEGPAKAGGFLGNDAAPVFIPDDAAPLDAGPKELESSACCTVTFTLEDATGDESVARVRGDFGPLAGNGLPLTWSNGRWSASACMPVQAYVKYGYFFGQVPEDPSSDAGPLVDDLRINPDEPRVGDGNGGITNLFDGTLTCSPDGGPTAPVDGG